MFEPQHWKGGDRKIPEPYWPARRAENNVERDWMTRAVALWPSRAHVQALTA